MYFKILKNNMMHHGFQYREGLNTDVNEFDSYPICGGGLFFSDEQNILRFCNYGDKIAIVTIPDGEQVVPVDTKYKAHSIILSEIKDLWTVETFKWLESLSVNIYSNMLISTAAANGQLDIVKFLAEYKTDISTGKDTALRFAAERGYLEIVKYLVEHGTDIHIMSDAPLRWAANNGHLDVVKYLVEQGANIHANSENALICALINNHLETAKYLISKGADTSFAKKYGFSMSKFHKDLFQVGV